MKSVIGDTRDVPEDTPAHGNTYARQLFYNRTEKPMMGDREKHVNAQRDRR